jgi:ketosteroid isomerase-like protein
LQDDDKLDVLAKVMDGFNAHDAEAIVANFTDDAAFESPRGPDPWGRRFGGKEAVRGVSEWTLTGTTTDGERLEVRGCDIWTFRGDRIALKNSFWKIVDRA